MKTTTFLTAILLAASTVQAKAQYIKATYEPEDSIRVVEILQESKDLPKKTNDVLFFANKFVGVPYVAATLERNQTEQVSFFLKELDCTTFVDVVTAFTLCHRHQRYQFSDFLHYLRQMRYHNGIVDGYASRNHYFSSWVLGGEKQKLIHEVTQDKSLEKSPLTAIQNSDIYFMSKNPNFYAALQNNDSLVNEVHKTEQELSGKAIRYITTEGLKNSKELKKIIKDGDIFALVTKRGGLDVSHLGIAVWGKDGNLHILNASSLHKRVILEPHSMYDYMKPQKMQTGVRVVRIL